MSDVIEIELTWAARVEVRRGGVSLRRRITCSARDEAQAKERMTLALSVVWKDFEFLMEPTQTKSP